MINKILEKLGICIHKWKFIRTIAGPYCEVDVCEYIKCGKRKSFRIW